MTTPGKPAAATPATRTPGALKLIMCQIDGAVGRRCGSFASNGLPVTVRFPLTTQLLLAASASVSKPMRAKAAVATCALYASLSKNSGDTGSTFSCADEPLAFVSLPTTSTSIGEISGKSSARFSAGKTESAWRIISRRHVPESASKNILTTASESVGVQGRKLY